jgi:cytochrome c oxidase subunit 3
MTEHPSAHAQNGPQHPWHLVPPSPWPLLAALAAGLLAMATVLFMHQDSIGIGAVSVKTGLPGIIACAVLLAGFAAFWWRDVLKEARAEQGHSREVKRGLHYGMALFISSEVMFFVAFFWAYYSAALFPPAVLGSVWPPPGLSAPAPLGMPLVMTVILLSSGITVTLAHHAALADHWRKAAIWLAATVGLGAVFTLCQAHEYAHADFALTSGMFGSTFYMATGFHGAHVIIGTVFLAVCMVRAARGSMTPKAHFALTAAAWYWHFVDLVWLFLFVSIYWYGSA